MRGRLRIALTPTAALGLLVFEWPAGRVALGWAIDFRTGFRAGFLAMWTPVVPLRFRSGEPCAFLD